MTKNVEFSSLKKSNKKVVVGFDEAGRGSVLGYMVFCVMVFEVDNIPKDLKDSKLLTDQRRRHLFSALKNNSYAYKALHPTFINTQMRAGVNLNNISWFSVVDLLKLITEKFNNIECVYIDAIGTCDKFKKFLELQFSHKFVIESKADITYPVVSGAAIVAKVVRDDGLLNFVGNFGSGYPSDPNTKLWLSRNCNNVFGWGVGVRYTWGTAKNILGFNKSPQYVGKLSGFYLRSD